MLDFVYMGYGEWRAYSKKNIYYSVIEDNENSFNVEYLQLPPDYRISMLENGRFTIEKSSQELIGNKIETFRSFDDARDWCRLQDIGSFVI